MLDVGSGPGLWRDWFRRHRPSTFYRSVDISSYACKVYGHERRDISRWRTRDRYDLVICHGVLHYLDDVRCEAAIENLAAMAGGFLYVEIPTAHDLRHLLDSAQTDRDVYARSAEWYRKRLRQHFVLLGCGLLYSRKGRLRFYDLERCS